MVCHAVSGSPEGRNKDVHALNHDGWQSVFESLRARQNNKGHDLTEGDSRRRLGRRLTAEELERVLRRYWGDLAKRR